MSDERLIEAVARAIAPLAWAALGARDTYQQGNRRTASLRHASAALAAIRAADFAIVPTEGPEFEAMERRAAEAIFNEFFGGTSDPGLGELASETAWSHARTALRVALGVKP